VVAKFQATKKKTTWWKPSLQVGKKKTIWWPLGFQAKKRKTNLMMAKS